MKSKLLEKLICFLISIVIVLLIFVGIVGIFIPLLIESKIEHIKILSLIFSLIGGLIILLSRRWPIIRFISFMRKPVKCETKYFDVAGSLVVGLSFLIGGSLYSHLGTPTALFVSLVAGAAILRILIMFLNHKNKNQT